MGMKKEITVSADKEYIYDISIGLYLDINSIDEGLKDESFKFELYKDGTLVKSGNFSEDYLTSNLSSCETNEGVSHITLTEDTVTTEESVYTLYTWIDGNTYTASTNTPRVVYPGGSITGCDSIHPGFGFLSENSQFAKVCKESNIKFIGPTSEVIDLLGNKSNAKEMMKKYNIDFVL